MADSYNWAMAASPVTSYGGCYGPLAVTNHGAPNFYFPDDESCAAAETRRRMQQCACAADDRLPVGTSRDQYYGPLPQQQPHPQLGWFSVRNVLIPLSVGTSTTAMTTPATSTTLPCRREDDAKGEMIVFVRQHSIPQLLVVDFKRKQEAKLSLG